MLNTILGSKLKMGQTYIEDTRIPVTRVLVGPCVVTHVKNQDKDGYWSVQIGFGSRRIKTINKSLQGHLRGVIKEKTAPRFLREVRLDKEPEYKVGDVIKVSDVLKRGDLVNVTGISKGKGFAGVVKRWGFAGGPKTHGQSDRQRAPGSIGQGTTPGRIWKGKKMAGRMGTDKVTIKNLVVVEVNTEKDEILVSGAVPGNNKGLLVIKRIASGKLEELVHETPQVQIQEGEETEVKDDNQTTPTEETKKEDSQNA